MANDWMKWYDALNKPSWTPRPNTIGLIWNFLYPIIFGVNIYVWIKFFRKELPFIVVLPFLINLVVNLAFTPVQFGLKSLIGATICIVITWLTIVWAMIAIWPHNHWMAYLFIPYLIWVTIASILQFSITLSN